MSADRGTPHEHRTPREVHVRAVPSDRLRFEKKAPLGGADLFDVFPCLPRPDERHREESCE